MFDNADSSLKHQFCDGVAIQQEDGDCTLFVRGLCSRFRELASGNGYTSGGQICTVTDVTVDGSVAIVDFADQSWTSATFTARGCLIYNSTKSNKTVAVIDFGGEKTATNGTFTVQMPAAAAATAIVRLA